MNEFPWKIYIKRVKIHTIMNIFESQSGNLFWVNQFLLNITQIHSKV